MAEEEQARAGGGVVSHSGWLTPALLLYHLCCWPQEGESDTSSERHGSRRGTLGHHEPGSHHRLSELFSRRMGSSAVSLHLPSTSGDKKEPLSAHRSHEEIGRRKSHHLETREDSARYHSAPSVIHEVVHRRDWERSTRELHIPLHADCEALSSSSGSPEPPRAEPDPSDLEDYTSHEQIVGRTCKKHHTNIKSSKVKKERQADEDKDCDATETSSFYIGDNECASSVTSQRNEGTDSPANCSVSGTPRRDDVNLQTKWTYRAKEAKQSLNESIRSKDRPRQRLVPLDEHQPRSLVFCLDEVLDRLESLDRSGATHHTIESRISLSKPPYPPPSVEAVGYEGGACYLAAGAAGPPAPAGAAGPPAPAALLRARHASDGDILAPPLRPESGAFSESDLDLELEGAESEQPPPYEQLVRAAPPGPPAVPAPRHPHYSDRKETAI